MSEAPNHIFFVHGIGKHAANWVHQEDDGGTTLRAQLEKAWALYNAGGKLGDFDEQLDLISVDYDFIFTDLYALWAEEMSKLKMHLAAYPGLSDRLDPLIRIAERPSQGTMDDEFFYSHVLDVIWYWGNTVLQGTIVAEVAKQITSHIRKHYGKTGHTFSIVAHSMGTSIVHKVLQALWTQSDYDNALPDGQLLSRVLKFRVLMQVSNTSFALSADRDGHYRTLVKPSAVANKGVCQTMINVSHRYDVVSETIPFDPPRDEWLDAYTQWGKGYLDIDISRMTRPNVHSLCHYFENPLVHIPFFERVINRRIPTNLQTAALEAFHARTPEGQFKKLRSQFEAIKAQGHGGIPEFITSIREFVSLIRTFG